MDPITVALQQQGADEVKAALRSVQDAIVALDSFAASSARRAGRDRVRAVREEAQERRRLASSGKGSSQASNDVRAAFKRALGETSGASVRRASAGPSIADMSGGASSLTGLIGKAGAAGAAFAIFKGAIDFASDALKQFGGFLISDVIKPAFELETRAQQVANASGGAMSGKEIEAQSRAAGISHNMDPAEMLSAAELINDAIGDLKGSFALLDTVGTLAKARGADTEQLAQFAAELKKLDPNASAEKISNLLMTQLAQGDKGSVPLKEAARLGGRLTAPAAVLAGDIDSRMAAMGALMQTGRKGFGTTDELATAMGNLISEVSSQKMIGAEKYLGRDENGKVTSIIQDIPSLISGILAQTGGNAKKISALGLSDPASKLVKAYLPTFMEAGKGEKGKEAVETLIRSFMHASTSIEIEKANERKVLQTSGEKWTATIEGLKNKLLDVMPEVQKFVDQFAKIAPQFGGALVTLAKIMIKVANYLAGLFGEEAVNENTATGETRGEYKINPTTGQFEFVKQSELNAQKANDIFDPLNYKGEGLKLNIGEKKPSDTNAEGNASTASNVSSAPGSILSPLLPTSQPMSISLPGISSAPTSSAPNTAAVDDALASLDALGPKAKNLGLMFDKLAVAGNDAARTKPLSQR